MSKLTKEHISQLAVYGIVADSELHAKALLIEQLEKHGLTGMDDEDLPSLLQYREAFPVDGEEEEQPAPKKKAAKKVVVEEEEEEEEEAPAPKKVTKKPAPKVEVEEEEEELAEEVEEVKPKKTVEKVKKTVVVAKEDSEKAKVGRKPASGELLDKDNATQVSVLVKKLVKIFNVKEYDIKPIVGGVTIRFFGANAKIVILKFSNVRVEGASYIGDLNFKKIKETEELKKILPEETVENKTIEKVSGRNYVRICDISATEVVELLSDEELLLNVLKKAKAVDKKMGINRDKMEESLKEGEKKVTKKPAPKVEVEEEEEEVPPVKPTTKKKPVVQEPEEEEEEVEEEQPAPKKKAAKKVVVEEEEEEEEEAPAPKKVVKKKATK